MITESRNHHNPEITVTMIDVIMDSLNLKITGFN